MDAWKMPFLHLDGNAQAITADLLVRQGLSDYYIYSVTFIVTERKRQLITFLTGCVFARLVILASKCYHLLLDTCPLRTVVLLSVRPQMICCSKASILTLFYGLGLLDTSESLCVCWCYPKHRYCALLLVEEEVQLWGMAGEQELLSAISPSD